MTFVNNLSTQTYHGSKVVVIHFCSTIKSKPFQNVYCIFIIILHQWWLLVNNFTLYCHCCLIHINSCNSMIHHKTWFGSILLLKFFCKFLWWKWMGNPEVRSVKKWTIIVVLYLDQSSPALTELVQREKARNEKRQQESK